MKIFFVSPLPANPPTRGSAVRMSALPRYLARHHDVRQFSQLRFAWSHFVRRSEEILVAPHYRERHWRPTAGGLLNELAERSWVTAPVLAGLALRLERPGAWLRLLAWADVAIVDFPWQFEACRRAAPGTPLVLATHNVELRKFRDYARVTRANAVSRRFWLRLVERAERGAVRDADLVLAVSDAERRELMECYEADPERVIVVPNGADTHLFRPASPEQRRAARRRLGLPERPTVVFAGSDVPPNRVGLDWVRRLAARSDRFTFLVLGAVCPPQVRGSFHAMGVVDDFAACLDAADMAVCPIEYGAGTKIKLLETMAAGLPNVAFAESLVGLAARDGEHAVIVKPREEDLLSVLQRWADQPEEARCIGAAAADLVARRYAWADIATDLDRELEARFAAKIAVER